MAEPRLKAVSLVVIFASQGPYIMAEPHLKAVSLVVIFPLTGPLYYGRTSSQGRVACRNFPLTGPLYYGRTSSQGRAEAWAGPREALGNALGKMISMPGYKVRLLFRMISRPIQGKHWPGVHESWVVLSSLRDHDSSFSYSSPISYSRTDCFIMSSFPLIWSIYDSARGIARSKPRGCSF